MTDIIQLLPDHVANQIAAGEVIQRPASAVKELLENSIDAGSTEIKLIIRDAGKTLIQVIDNGCGMSETDARMCFERHATSKIKDANDLFNLKSMGFRGEAMASIAAIAHIELKTKLKNNELGTLINIEGSIVTNQENCTLNNGTSISIKNLFFNVPARRNFLKSDNIELKHIIEEFSRISLANPDCHLSMYHNDNEVFNLPASVKRQRIKNLIGKNINEKLVPIKEKTNLIDIDGFVGKPEFARKTRGEQYFFVNNRFIKSGYLHHAIVSAYKDLIPSDHIPSYFLFFNIDPKSIDINIHPTKTEIKFDDEKSIYAILRSSIKHGLGQHNITPTLDFNKDPAFDTTAPKGAEIKIPSIKVDPSYNPFDKKDNSRSTTNSNNWEKLFENNETVIDNQNSVVQSSFENEEEINNGLFFQIHKKYILSPIKSGLMIVHQQRAHQKILFDQFITNGDKNDSQQLLFPQTIELSAQDLSIVKENTEQLLDLGFRFDYLNKNSIVILGIPELMSQDNLNNTIEEILEEYKNSLSAKTNHSKNLIQATSISLSINSGRALSQIEMSNLIDQLFSLETPQIGLNNKKTYITISNQEIANKFNL
jgi:DNA mismatch repair protein MutL